MSALRNQRGFTLMELMVVIVIVAILAAVAVPLYVNYVKDAQRTEAKGAIGAIITAQQAYYQRSAMEGAATYADLATLKGDNDPSDPKYVDLTEPEVSWTFDISGPTPDGYTVTATHKDDATLKVTYVYTRVGGGTFYDGDAPGGLGAN